MSRFSLSRTFSLASLGLIGSFALAGAAEAAALAPAPCAVPTPAQCHDPLYLQTACGVQTLAATKVDPNHICNQTLSADGPVRAAALAQRTVLVPATTTTANAVVAGGGTTLARIDNTRTQPAKSVLGMTTLYYAKALRDSAAVSAGLAFDIDPNAPADNGIAVANCSEYAREKYWDISLWEDAAKLVGEDYRAMYTVAYGNIGLRESIGERGRQIFFQRGQDNQIRSRDLTIQAPNFDAAAGPKNTFFSANLANPGTQAFPGSAAAIELAYGSPLRLKGVVLSDPALVNTLNAGRAVKFESFQWHKDMSTALAGTLDEQLYTFDALKTNFASLLKRRVDQVEKSRKELIGVYNVQSRAATASCNTAYNIAAHSFSADAEAIADATCDQAWTTAQNAMNTARNSVDNRLAALDASIEASLVQARAQGCLNTAGVTTCDWSPKLFVESVHGRYVKRREADYQACLVYTANNFANLVNAAFPGRVATNYTTSTAAVDTYIALKKAQVAAAVAAMEGSLQPAAGGDIGRIGNKASDNGNLGNADFGASWAYGYDWRVFNVAQNTLCNVNASFAGDLDASARAFGRDQTLIDAHMDASYTRARAQLSILDQSLVNVDQALGAEQYNLARSSTNRTNNNLTGARPTAWFSILGIPVRVSAGMAGTLGLDYEANVLVNRGNVNTGCTTISASFEGMFAPYVNVDATAEAAADFLVAAVGVKVDLALVHLRLPLGVTVTLTSPAGQIASAVLSVKATLDAAIRNLDGRLAAFARLGVCPFCTESEQTIFSWSGFERTFTLFNKTASVTIGNIAPWFAANGG